MPGQQSWGPCAKCNLTIEELGLAKGRGDGSKHERLCLGLDRLGKPIGMMSTCVCCDYNFESKKSGDNTPPDSIMKHYRRQHEVSFTDDKDIFWLARRENPDLYPSTDLNNGYGVNMTRKSYLTASVSSQRISDLYQLYGKHRMAARSQYSNVLKDYTMCFA